MPGSESLVNRQRRSTEKRVAERTEARRARIDLLGRPGGIARADDPIRVASRIDRLSRYNAEVGPIGPAGIIAQDPDALAAAGDLLERVILTSDFLAVRYLEAGAAAARAVGRVNIRDDRGRITGYGTGSLVSPELLLTNHHVLPDAGVAATSGVEFNYQDGVDGQPLQPRMFTLDPERFFTADEKLDMALVAVHASPEELAPFGFNRLIEAEGKAIVGDFVTIVQHPKGEKKQVALRENRIVDVVDRFLHYETDTEPGSSGSPVFNDQWEVIALHHAGVPAPDHGELGGFVNEGVRVSRLVDLLRGLTLPPHQRAVLDRLFMASPEAPMTPPQAARMPGATTQAATGPDPAPAALELPQTNAVVTTVPLRLEVRIEASPSTVPASTPPPLPPPVEEAVVIDPDYASRKGYDPEFLGAGPHRVPLPTLPDHLASLAAADTTAEREPRYVLPYHHFSVVLNAPRRLAFFTAVNIDGASSVRIRREPDRWFYDPRISQDSQAGEDVYTSNPLDRGHLVRRLDPAWGPTPAAAKINNDDTFHFTNCTPQHKDFNENRTTWAGLENYILDNADNRNFRVNVFTGPVLADDDDAYRGVQLPRQFWKVVSTVKKDGALSATAYLLSQEALIAGLEVAPAEFSYGAYRTYQVPVRKVEALTGLSFGELPNADPLELLEDLTAAREVARLDQLVF